TLFPYTTLFRSGRQPLVFPEFLPRLRIVFKGVAEEGPRPGGKISEQTRPRPQQIHGPREPLALRICPFRLPQSSAGQLSFYVGQQFVNRQLLQVLRVEPFELGTIEDG